MRSLWKGTNYCFDPLLVGRTRILSAALLLAPVLVYTGRRYLFQRPRNYYLTGPYSLFVKTRPTNSPIRLKYQALHQRKVKRKPKK